MGGVEEAGAMCATVMVTLGVTMGGIKIVGRVTGVIVRGSLY